MSYLILILKGFIIGIAKIIPGVSGAMLAISMGLYEKMIEAISNFFINPIKNLKILFPVGIGVILAVILGSKVVIYLINNYYLSTMLLFIGLIIGGIPLIFKNIKIKEINYKHYIIFLTSFCFVFLISLVGVQNYFIDYQNGFVEKIIFFVIGVIDATTMVIPGISGTAVMMLLGCYDILLSLMSSLTDFQNILFNITLIIPYMLGVGICILLLSKLMNYLFQKKEQIIYSSILGFSLSSIILLLFEVFNKPYSIFEILIAIHLLIIGFLISYKLDN